MDFAYRCAKALASRSVTPSMQKIFWEIFTIMYEAGMQPASVSLTDLAKRTGVSNVPRALTELIRANILASDRFVTGGTDKIVTTLKNSYRINKDIATWGTDNSVTDKTVTTDNSVTTPDIEILFEQRKVPVLKKSSTKNLTPVLKKPPNLLTAIASRPVLREVAASLVLAASRGEGALLIEYFRNTCIKEKEFEPMITWARDGAIAKKRLKQMDLGMAKACIDHFLSSDKSDKIGVTFAIAMSDHSVNAFRKEEAQGKRGSLDAEKKRFERICGVPLRADPKTRDLHRAQAGGSRGPYLDGPAVSLPDLEAGED